MSRWLIVVLVAALVFETFATTPEDPIIVRSKRQQCRCVKNPNGGLTCSCAKGPANGSSAIGAGTSVQHDVPQSTDIANQLTAMQQQGSSGQNSAGQARCGCIQIVFQGTPSYNCQCADNNGNQPTTTTIAPTTTSTTTTTTTTTTQAPTTTVPTTTFSSTPSQQQPGNGNGACNCIMISISSPQTAQYQCQCAQPQSSAEVQPDFTQPQVSSSSYQPLGVSRNATQDACYCMDPATRILSSQCGCACDCVQLTAYPSDTFDYTQQPSTQSPFIYTQPSTIAPTTTTTTTTTPLPVTTDTSTQYPLTTTCVMYVNVPTSACSCLPQYDQCAQNVCCLKSKYRSMKKTEESSPSTIDMLMDVLKTIKNKWE
ncbi:unnamed protein product [Caenorhabditis angaria]|uniref:Uncharacterized protein n=1 Tax=Caenorhabditis angaria TaxID=860376 RepID=A0A9P1I919_9PELO|nr:unnamed protein product [Caenorhabditis angaria]